MNHMNVLGKKYISILIKRYEDMNHMNGLGENNNFYFKQEI
jgi:hypothetical protein